MNTITTTTNTQLDPNNPPPRPFKVHPCREILCMYLIFASIAAFLTMTIIGAFAVSTYDKYPNKEDCYVMELTSVAIDKDENPKKICSNNVEKDDDSRFVLFNYTFGIDCDESVAKSKTDYCEEKADSSLNDLYKDYQDYIDDNSDINVNINASMSEEYFYFDCWTNDKCDDFIWGFDPDTTVWFYIGLSMMIVSMIILGLLIRYYFKYHPKASRDIYYKYSCKAPYCCDRSRICKLVAEERERYKNEVIVWNEWQEKYGNEKDMVVLPDDYDEQKCCGY